MTKLCRCKLGGSVILEHRVVMPKVRLLYCSSALSHSNAGFSASALAFSLLLIFGYIDQFLHYNAAKATGVEN